MPPRLGRALLKRTRSVVTKPAATEPAVTALRRRPLLKSAKLKNCAEVGPPRLSNSTAAIANAISGTLPLKMPFSACRTRSLTARRSGPFARQALLFQGTAFRLDPGSDRDPATSTTSTRPDESLSMRQRILVSMRIHAACYGRALDRGVESFSTCSFKRSRTSPHCVLQNGRPASPSIQPLSVSFTRVPSLPASESTTVTILPTERPGPSTQVCRSRSLVTISSVFQPNFSPDA